MERYYERLQLTKFLSVFDIYIYIDNRCEHSLYKLFFNISIYILSDLSMLHQTLLYQANILKKFTKSKPLKTIYLSNKKKSFINI